MYERTVTSVRTTCRETGEFPVTAQSRYLFALIMDELTDYIQEKVPWYILFADDIVLVDESRDDVNAKLER